LDPRISCILLAVVIIREEARVHCETCGAAHRGRGRLCDECTKTLSGFSEPNKLAPLGDFNTDQTFPAPQPQQPLPKEGGWNEPKKPLSKEGGWDQPELVRTDVIPLTLAGRPLKRGWLTALGAAGVLMTIGDIAFRWGVWWFWLFIPSGIAFLVGRGLMRKGFVRLVGAFNLEADKAGRISLTTLGGDCPVCNGEIKLKDIGPSRHLKTVIQCMADETHQWAFNPKRLDRL
jgi:energy-coupling factor transport system substrate-specific component